MSFELRFATIASENLTPVPPEVADQIEAGLKKLAADPEAHSRPAVCPPFPPFGYQCDIPCYVDGRFAYNCIVFFIYSDCGKFLDCHRMMIQGVGMAPHQLDKVEADLHDVVELPKRRKPGQ